MADNSEQINTNAQSPKRVTVDGNTAEQFPVKDQIDADRYAKSGGRASNKYFGIRRGQLRNQGTT